MVGDGLDWASDIRAWTRHSTLVGVGMGPGDPDLITFQAADRLTKADMVFVPVADADLTGRAERMVLSLVEAWRVEQVPFGAHGAADPGRGTALAAAADTVAAWFGEHPGAVAAFAVTGDPCLHSVFPALARAVGARVPDLVVEFVPGITPMQALAARRGVAVVEPGESLAVLPGDAGSAALRTALGRFDGVVVERVGAHLPRAWAQVAAAGRTAGAVFGPHAPDDAGVCDAALLDAALTDVEPLDTADSTTADPDTAVPYLSTMIVPAARVDG